MSVATQPTCYRHPDRPTGLSCSECGRPICTECMTMAPVGIRCPDHSGKPQGAQRIVRSAQRVSATGRGAYVTRALIAVNVLVYAAELAQGSGIMSDRGQIFLKGVLFGPSVAQGDYWRLITACFLHYGPFHLLINMYSLLFLGSVLEETIGRWRFLLLYLASGLAGSAGALFYSPFAPTVGASGAIFGLLGAGVVLERQGRSPFLQGIGGLLVANLIITFALRSYISVGAHVGGAIGGALATLALSRFGRGSAAYGRLGVLGYATIVAVGIASVAVAYWKVHHLGAGV